MTSQGMTRPSASRTPSRVSSPRSSSGRPSTSPIPSSSSSAAYCRRQGKALGEEGHVAGEHLLHADAEAHAVDGAVDDEQLPAGGAVAVADHAGEVGDAEEAMEILEWGEALPGPRGGYDKTGAVGLPRSLHLEMPLPDLDTLHLGALNSDAEALRLGEAGFQEVRARNSAAARGSFRCVSRGVSALRDGGRAGRGSCSGQGGCRPADPPGPPR